MSAALIWLIVAIVALGVEVFTVGLSFGIIAVGAGAAAAAAALGAPLIVQALVGLVVSVAGIVLIRPIALRHLRRPPRDSRTGIDALPGTRAEAISAITDRDGRIRMRGEVWSARLDADVTTEPVAEGSDVVVTRIDGATALVYPVDPL